MTTRTGVRPLRAMTLVEKGSISPSEAFPPKMASMTTLALAPAPSLDLEPYLKIAYAAFLDTLGSSDDEQGRKLAANPPSFQDFELLIKESGLMDNLKAWGGYFKSKVTGGDFAQQMRGLTGGASSGMSGLRETINPGLQQIKGPGELALRHQAQVQQATRAADTAAMRLRAPALPGSVDRSLATNPLSPEAFGLASQAKKITPQTIALRSQQARPAAAPAVAAAAPQTPVAPADFLRGLAQRKDPSLGAFGRDPLLGARAARLAPAMA